MDNVLEWLEQRATDMPEACAFSDVDSSLSFEQLRQRARVAGTFLSAHCRPTRPVALYLEKSTKAIAAMLGATYARCPYCVLDVRQPAQRVESIVATLAPELVLTDEANREAAHELFEPLGIIVYEVEALKEGDIDEGVLGERRASSLDVDPLYINFTSGSTGVPKGVVVGHRSVIDFIGRFTRIFGFSSEDRIGNQAPFDFDVSVKDIYGGLATGASVHMIPREYFSQPALLMDFLVEREITVCTWAVSAMCFVSIMGGFEYRVPETIRKVIFSGEVMPIKQLAVWRTYLPDAMFVNVYGPTEVTCNCTYYILEREFGKDEVIPIGRPFPNEHVFLLDEDAHEVSEPGAHGEIIVSGSALALGYYNDPERTAQAFIQNPLNSAYDERVYKTGDLGYWSEDGELCYVGRKDNQIKHLGQRIELGEIEAAAQAVDGVERAVCLYNERKKKLILCFIGNLDKKELVEKLRAKLPQYMVPNKTVPVEEMPLTKNGKVDRRKLSEQVIR